MAAVVGTPPGVFSLACCRRNALHLCCSYCDCALIHNLLLLLQFKFSSSSLSALQASLRPEPHQQPVGQAEHPAAPALHGCLRALLHPVVGCQDQQLLQLRYLVERPPPYAGNAIHPGCRQRPMLGP